MAGSDGPDTYSLALLTDGARHAQIASRAAHARQSGWAGRTARPHVAGQTGRARRADATAQAVTIADGGVALQWSGQTV